MARDPESQQVEHAVIKPEDVAAFLDAAPSARFGAYWTLLFFSGLTSEEALALPCYDAQSVPAGRTWVKN